MALYLSCDYCGQPIDEDELHVKISAEGRVPSTTGHYPDREWSYFGHYHSEPRGDGERSCYGQLCAAIDLMHDVGPTLETIETASQEWVDTQRRRMGDERTDEPSPVTVATVTRQGRDEGSRRRNRILELRKAARLAPEGLAAELGVGPGNVSSWQQHAHIDGQGRLRGISEKWAGRLAERFGVTVPFLLGAES